MKILTNNGKIVELGDFNGDIFTIEEFKKHCQVKLFIDSDGIGYYGIYYGTKTRSLLIETNDQAIPSHIVNNIVKLNSTHVIWYNK